MLQSASNSPASTPNTYAPAKTSTTPVEQATIGRSLVIKGELRGEESIYIDGIVEGTIQFGDHRVTVGRNGKVTANITAREVVVMGSVKGNVHCTDRVDIRAEGLLTGDIVTQRISVEDGALLKGSVQIRTADSKAVDAKNNLDKKKDKAPTPAEKTTVESEKAAEDDVLAAVAGN